MDYDSGSKRLILIGAAAAAGGCLIGISSAVLYQRLREVTELSALRLEVVALRREIRELADNLPGNQGNQAITRNNVNQNKSAKAPIAIKVGSEETEDFYDATESLDFNVFGSSGSLASGNHGQTLYIEGGEVAGPQDLRVELDRVDRLVESNTDADHEAAYVLLKDQYEKYKQYADYLWRMARATYLYSQRFVVSGDSAKRKALCFEAKDYAFDALELNETDADIQKWCALTLGTLTDFVNMNDKIQYGYRFREHIEKALALKAEDAMLHHLLGRYCFGVASLSWIERKVAATLFSEPPLATFDEALNEFLEAERMNTKPWKENQLFIAKCHVAVGNIPNALDFLLQAKRVPIEGADDKIAHDEVETLLRKYGG